MTQAISPALPAPAPSRPQRSSSDFTELARLVRDAGLLQRRYVYYAVTITLTLAAFVGAWVLFALLGDSWWQLAVAALLAVVSAQLAFIGHDAGHKQIFRGRRANDVTGYGVAALVGLSFGWWVGKHNRHHANPNHEDEDPDLDIPILAFTEGQGATKRGFHRWTTKNQAYLFFPLLLLEGLSLHWAAVDAAFRGTVKHPWLERVAIVAHVVLYFAALFVVLPWPMAIAFFFVHQCLWGLYMGCSFAPNHKGMATMSAGDSTDFLRKQVLTSRDVGGRWSSAVLGGLNYQIEHHLFPNMPRPSLRRAQPIVEAYCGEHGISYTSCSAWRSYTEVLRHLHLMGAPLRATREPAA